MSKPTLKKHYPTQGLVTPLLATSKLRFMADPFPALDCNLDPTPSGWSSVPGVLDGLVTETTPEGRKFVHFNMGIYNSSLTERFTIANTPENIDSHGDVKEFWQAELLDQNANHLQYGGDQLYARFSCEECRPVQCGYERSNEYLTLSPQWADIYPDDMDNQWFDMTGRAPGRYIIRYIVDPLEKYGEYQVYQYDVIWDGENMTAR